EHVDRLRDVRHRDPPRVPMEDIEVETGHQGVTHGVLLEEETRVGALLDVPPGAPLVTHERHAVIGVVGVHHGNVTAHHALHSGGVGHGVVVLRVAERHGVFGVDA